MDLNTSKFPIVTDDQGFKYHPLLKWLVRIDLDLTGLCNRQCSFCPRALDANPVYPNVNKHMSLDTLQIVIDEMKSIKFRGYWELAGRGESTLHKNFDTIVEMLSTKDRTWKLRLTTNGYEIDEWWPTLSEKFDGLILNSYESYDQFVERKAKYEKLPNGELVEHHYKQDGFTIEQINKMPRHLENDGKWYNYAFNNRAGYFSDEVVKSRCWHPMRQIFIDYDGNYQMCCNDWLSQIKIGNVHERSLIDMYINDEKINRIRWLLLTEGNRSKILPCSKCDDIQGTLKNSRNTMDAFVKSPAYRHHIVPLSACGKKFDDGILEGK